MTAPTPGPMPQPIHLMAAQLPAQLGKGPRNAVDWRLTPNQRDLDANIISISPAGHISNPQGPELGVLLHIISGDGQLETEAGSLELQVGDVVWLPPRAPRLIRAGNDGLRYFSVHQRNQELASMVSISEITARIVEL